MNMASSSLPGDWKRVIGELTRGREIADKLRLMLRETDGVGGASGLVGKILDSFTESISILCGGGDSDEVSQVPPPLLHKSEDSGDSCKTPAPKDRRGCYKRRRSSETTIKETRHWLEDEHAWRKYGQKVILHAKHPRNYFRCTHKFDQGCQASKQVQKIQDDPPLFRTTYHGRHTCKNLFKSSVDDQIIMDATATATGDSSILWNFQAQEEEEELVQPHYCINNPINSTAVPVKKEACQIRSPSSPSDPDYFIPVPFDDHHTFRAFSSGSDHGDVISSDVYSCTASTHSMDINMNMMVSSVNISDFLEFDRLN